MLIMIAGIERASLSSIEAGIDISQRHKEAALAVSNIIQHFNWLSGVLGYGSDGQFRPTDEDLANRAKYLDLSRAGSHATHRDVRQLGLLLHSTVSQVEQEFARKRVLDIGCGEGRAGTELARKAKSNVTFLDIDPDIMKRIGPKDGKKVVANGNALPFADASFDRTMSSFSTLTWARTPMETISAIAEPLRVTKTGGSAMFVPALTNSRSLRDSVQGAQLDAVLGKARNPELQTGSLYTWAAQDYIAINALMTLDAKGYTDTSLRGYIASGQKTGATIESYTAIVDVVRPIPSEEFDQLREFASNFMPEGYTA